MGPFFYDLKSFLAKLSFHKIPTFYLILAPHTQIWTMTLRILMLTFQAAPFFRRRGIGVPVTRTVCGMVIPAKSPTVCLHIEVPATRACTCSDGRTCTPWDWRALECPTRLPEEYAYTRHDLDRVMRSYAHVWAQTAARQRSDNRFRLVARGLFSGRVLATYTWGWNAVYGRYEPEAEPWNLWDERCAEGARERVPYTLSGFSRLVVGMLPDRGPYVRHKEDVPHEGALADLYGEQRAA